jgi:hypothetical protein
VPAADEIRTPRPMAQMQLRNNPELAVRGVRCRLTLRED